MLKLIVAGSREFNDYELLAKTLDDYLKDIEGEVEIVSGGARGADKLGERYAEERGYRPKRFRAKWSDIQRPGAIVRVNKYGQKYDAAAGHIRNTKMGEYADEAVIFLQKRALNRGSLDMNDIMKTAGKKSLLIK